MFDVQYEMEGIHQKFGDGFMTLNIDKQIFSPCNVVVSI